MAKVRKLFETAKDSEKKKWSSALFSWFGESWSASRNEVLL